MVTRKGTVKFCGPIVCPWNLVRATFSYSGGHSGTWTSVFKNSIQCFPATPLPWDIYLWPPEPMWELIFNSVCVVVTLRVWKMENCILEDLSVLINNWAPAQMASPLWNLSRPLELLEVLSLYPKEMFSDFFYHVHLSLTWNFPLRCRAPWKQEPSLHYVWIRTSSESM